MGWAGTRTLLVVGAGVLVVAAVVTAAAGSVGQEITVMLPGNVPLVFVRIPAGTFSMGSPSGERNRGDDETHHQVTLTRDYYIGKFEVTQAQWQAVMGSNPSYFKSGGDYPVEQVTWNEISEAEGFLARLNRHLTSTGQPGAGRMRLPTEAEWERAARGRTTTRFSFGEALECDDFCKSCATHTQYMRWCGNNTSGRPDRVGSREPNPYGLHYMHGNVFEWVQDWYGPYSPSAQKDPKGPWKGSDRVIRGGRSDSPANWCRSAYRAIKSPDGRDAHTGLRLAWSP